MNLVRELYLRVVAYSILWAGLQAAAVYAVDRTLIAAVNWFIIFLAVAFVEVSFFLRFSGTVGSGLSSGHSRRVIDDAMFLSMFVGLFFGPPYLLVVSRLGGVDITGFNAAIIGLLAGTGLFFAIGLIVGFRRVARYTRLRNARETKCRALQKRPV